MSSQMTQPLHDPQLVLEECITAWLWSSSIEPDEQNEYAEEQPFDEWAEQHEATLDSATRTKWENDVDTFLEQAHNLLLELEVAIGAQNVRPVGHDIALTRNGHGAGFWDRGYPDHIGEGLSEIAQSLGQIEPYAYKKDGEWFIGHDLC